METKIATTIAEKLRQARHVVLLPGTNPDGDSVGAACAMYIYLKKHDVQATVFCPVPVHEQLQFLPYSDRVTNDTRTFAEGVDVIVTLDAGDIRYAGLADHLAAMPVKPCVINIDHHVSNNYYGDINLVATNAAATTELLYSFFKIIGMPLNEDIATCLLTGIITDTDYFSNDAATAETMSIASDLIVRGARLHTIRKHTLNNKPVALLKLWGIALARLYYHPVHNSAITYLFRKDYEHFGLSEADVYGIPNFLNNLGEGNYSLFLKESQDGFVKCSLRTTRDDVDLSELARRFGGGGHRKAAGFTVPGRLEETQRGVKIAQNDE